MSSIGQFFTDTGLKPNANNSIVITDTTLAGAYVTEFEETWAGSLHEDKADNTLHLLDWDGTGVEHFAPTDPGGLRGVG
ncbi:MAG TPA: hypothetical protein VMY40_00245 [Anaerolineae bacterium]|nr:hypothetical protein [Anaerolineae bacterium]